MAYVINSQNVHNVINQSDHKNKPTSKLLIQDLKTFLEKNPACACTLVALNVDNKGK